MTLKEQFDALDMPMVMGFLGNQEENLHLDFKQLNASDFKHADDRKNLAKVIAGFANSDGGICVWGVDCRRVQGGPDLADKIVEVTDRILALSRLNELTSSAANPVVDGVVHLAIPTTGKAGVLATYVPPSDSGPHMAKLGEDRYFKRSGESFVKMEHFDIEDMFGRRAKPKLTPIVSNIVSAGSRTDPKGETLMRSLATVSIRNDGRAAAVGPFLAINVPPPQSIWDYGIDGNRNFGLPQIRSRHVQQWKAFGGHDGTIVYPGVNLDILSIEIETPEGQYISGFEVPYRLAAINHRLVEGQFEVSQRDIFGCQFVGNKPQ